MEPTVIMSKEFLEALKKEIANNAEVIRNFQSDENSFDLADYKRYGTELVNLLDTWAIVE